MKKLILSTLVLAASAGAPAFAQVFDPGFGPDPNASAQLVHAAGGYGQQLMPHGSCRYGSPTGQVIGTDVCFDGRGAPRAGIFMQPDGTGVATGQQYGQPMLRQAPVNMNGYPPNLSQGYRGQQPRNMGGYPPNMQGGVQYVVVDEDGLGSSVVGNNVLGELLDAGVSYCIQSLAFRGQC